MRGELEKINKERERAEAEKAAVRQNEANNWLESSRIRRDRTEFEIKIAIIKRDLEKRELQVREQEDQRRRNRFVLYTYQTLPLTFGALSFRRLSAAFIEDYFAALSPRAVLENLTLVPSYFYLSPASPFLRTEIQVQELESMPWPT